MTHKLIEVPFIPLFPPLAFIALLDNYCMEIGLNEITTEEEKKEINTFLDEVMKTRVMKEAHLYLKESGLTKSSFPKFKEELYDLWFQYYGRKR